VHSLRPLPPQGNRTAYLVCDLAKRAPEYVGECVAMNNTCVSSSNDTVPYNCTDLTQASRPPILGSLAVPDYRLRCETPCDRLFDCNNICECFDTCGVSHSAGHGRAAPLHCPPLCSPFQQPATCMPGTPASPAACVSRSSRLVAVAAAQATEFCECDACVALNVNAAADNQFVDIRSIVQVGAAARCAPVYAAWRAVGCEPCVFSPAAPRERPASPLPPSLSPPRPPAFPQCL
jgi:hypothetical protein